MSAAIVVSLGSRRITCGVVVGLGFMAETQMLRRT